MYGDPRPAILLSTEDDPEVDLGPRVEAAGGDRSLVAMPPTSFQLPRDIDWLRGYVHSISGLGHGAVGLIAVDPLANHTGAANTDRENEVRTALMPLAVFVNEIRIPTVGVRHLSTKEAKGGALAKVLGSTAWIGVPRVVLVAVADSDDPSIVHVHPVKGNRVGRSESGRRFKLDGKTLPGFTESVVYAVEDGVSDVDVDSELAGEKKESASEHARELIIATLREAGEQMESDTLDAAVAAKAGLNVRTVRNLRVELKDRGWLRAIPEKDSEGEIQRWFVALTNAAPDDASRGNAISRDLDYLSQSRDPDHHITYARGVIWDDGERCSGSPSRRPRVGAGVLAKEGRRLMSRESRTRVTVVLNRPELDTGEEPGYLSEWVHEDGYSTGEDGCRLDWRDGCESYFPWTSVLRVDWSPCACFECRGGATA